MNRALLIEDSLLVLHALQMAMADGGIVVVATATNVAQALAIVAAEEFDFALVDVNLGGEMAYPVVDALLARAIPLILTTGYTSAMLPARFSAIPFCQKPYDLEKLRKMIAAL